MGGEFHPRNPGVHGDPGGSRRPRAALHCQRAGATTASPPSSLTRWCSHCVLRPGAATATETTVAAGDDCQAAALAAGRKALGARVPAGEGRVRGTGDKGARHAEVVSGAVLCSRLEAVCTRPLTMGWCFDNDAKC